VLKHPNAPALVAGGVEYSYAELNRRANRLAHRLQAQGVVADEPVLLLTRRSPESIMALLAILKAGACVVPLDPDYPPERLQFMAADSGAAVALVQSGITAAVMLPELFAVQLDAGVFTASEYSDDNPTALVSSRSLAFLLYTSGTTGQPKGVELHHRGLVNYIHQLGMKTSVESGDRILQFASLSFDIFLEECFTALLNGAVLVLRTPGMTASMQDFLEGCTAKGITWISLPTAWWHELCRSLEYEQLQLPDGLRTVVIGGERARRDAFASWRRHAKGVRLFNTYGPTETSIAATWCELTHTDPEAVGELPIGSPVPNVNAWVLDARQQILPVGVPGMLYIGGIGVGRGYHNRADLTASCFVEVPGLPGRLYRTGDRARYLPDGRLIFMGREDAQLKVRGHRVEPGEIETRLTELVGVEQAVVVARSELHADVDSSDQLLAYIVGDADTTGLRAQLQTALPDYMVPVLYTRLRELPLTQNGKLDYRALPLPELETRATGLHAMPQTPTELQLAAIWSEVLGVTDIGREDDFFALGGHSLVATRVVARVRDALGVNLPLRVLFQEPTIAALARALDAGAASACDVRIVRRKLTDDLPPLSWTQQRLWFINQLEPDSAAYNIPWVACISGSLDVDSLQRAVNMLVERHESLRTTFAASEGEPVQVIAERSSVLVTYTDMTGDDRDSAQLQTRLCELADEPFSLHAGALFRVHVLQTDSKQFYLLLLMHHIVADGWSVSIVLRELAALYSSIVRREPVRLPELVVQYADYAVWQRQWLVGDELARQEGYWRTCLQDVSPLLELPLDKPRPEVQSYQGAWVSRRFSSELLAGIQQLALRQGCTVFMVLLAAFKVLLARHTGREDIVVGTPIAGRRHTEIEGLVGCFLNTLALRTDLGGNPRFTELLGRVRQTTLGAYEHQDLPFEKLLEVLQPARSTAYPPLVQVLFNLHNAPSAGLALDGLRVEAFNLDRATAKFDLSIVLTETSAGLQAGFEYNTDIFAAETVEHLLTHYGELLEAVVSDAVCRIADLSLSATRCEPQIQQSYEEFPAAVSCTSLVERFDWVVRRYAELPAVQTDVYCWTYAELSNRANAVARCVHSENRDKGMPVGLLLGHDANMVAGLLGVLKAGCAYVPLDIDAPPERISTLVAEAGIRVIVTDAAHRSCLPADPGGSRVHIEVAEVVDAEVAAPAVVIQPDDLAYVLFTSGSTGIPKGVMQSHRHVLHHVGTYTNALHIAPHDRLSLLSAYGFDAAVMDIFGALLNGACLFPVDIRGAARADSLAANLFDSAKEISVFHATPSVFRFLMAQLQAGQTIESVRVVVLGGEEALAADFELFRQHFSATAVFVNGLGPTESTLALQFFADTRSSLPASVVPVGMPVDSTRAVLVNEDGSDAGMVGELVICSPYVALGYWRQPELTRRQFTPDPDEPGVTRYRTGDRVRRLADGQLIFCGRVDQQVKVRGHRVELAEIEAKLAEHPGVHRCAVVLADRASAGGQADARLVAYLSGAATAAELRTWLLRSLPAYMCPAAFVTVDEFPLTPNGKLNRLALPAPSWDRDGSVPRVAARTQTEASIAAVWSDLLGIDEPGVLDDFFGLGGHSLLATSVIARLHKLLGKTISLRVFFTSPTIAGLAAVLDATDSAPAEAQLVRRAHSGDLPPLSWAQQRLWFLDQLEPQSSVYNLHWAARLHGEVNHGALQTAVDALLVRHESLRTTFGASDSEPVQLIATDVSVPVQLESVPGMSEERLQRRLLKLARQPFDLRSGPLLKVHLLQLSRNEFVLLLVIHHIVADGWSMGILFRELAILYNAAVTGEPAALVELPVQYADYALWQRQWLAGAELEKQEKYWRHQLSDIPPLLELPLDHPRPPVQRQRGAWVNQEFSAELLDQLRDLGRAQGCSLFMVLLAAFYVLLARYTGREDLLVGAPVAGRKRAELEGLIGFFLNTLVLRADLSANPEFTALLQQVRQTTLEAYDHQDLPFEKLLELLQPVRNTAHAPLVQVTFNLHNEPSAGLDLQGLQVAPFNIDRGTAKYDLSVGLVESAGGLQAGFEYNAAVFERRTVVELLAHYGELLAGIVAHPSTRISAFSLSSKPIGSCFELVDQCSHETFPADALHESVAHRFRQVAERYPERIAVQTADCALSYRELNAIANAVARSVLLAANGTNRRVALLLGHDANMLAGLLGVLKAGCAYVPLDPGAPAARIAAIIDDADISLVVTDTRHRDLLHAAVNGSTGVVEVPVGVAGVVTEVSESASAEDLAYILFTSGSTGTPKGVMQSQRNLLHHVRTYSNALRIDRNDHLALLASYCFDAAVMDIFAALLNGACLHPLQIKQEEYPGQLLDQMGLPDSGSDVAVADNRPYEAAKAAQGFGITILHCTPTVFRYLMRHKVCRHDLSGVRAVVLGGEEALASDFSLYKKHFAPPTLFVNGLGPSESTLATQFFANHETRLSGNRVPVGRAVADTEVLLLDAAGQPAGISGELVIRSPYVSLGYLNREQLTDEKFIADPVDKNMRLYRTGDRARILPDGQLVFLGRLDAQLKIRGHRVEPGEIESTLARLDGVERCVVLLRRAPAVNGSAGESRLVVYVVGAAMVADMRRHLQSILPDYMLPAAFEKLAGLPLTPNGKVDRHALPEPEWERTSDTLYVAPRTATEKRLAGIWTDVLGVADVGVHDDFFELGGHSLLAAQLVSRVTESMQVGLPLRKLFDAPTIADVAEHVETLQWALRNPPG
jgi:amino acid adenylation domain-containing protein